MEIPVVHSIFESLTSLTADAVGLIVVAALLFVWGLQAGKRHLLAFIVALYIGIAALPQFPYLDRVPDIGGASLGGTMPSLLVFAVLVLLCYFVARNFIAAEFPFSGSRRWFEAALLCLVATALLVTSAYHVVALAGIIGFHPLIDGIFASSQAFFWWLIAPLLALLIATKRSY